MLYLLVTSARVLAVLEALDRHCFDRVDPNNNLDTLYKEVFANCTSQLKDYSDAKDVSCLLIHPTNLLHHHWTWPT